MSSVASDESRSELESSINNLIIERISRLEFLVVQFLFKFSNTVQQKIVYFSFREINLIPKNVLDTFLS